MGKENAGQCQQGRLFLFRPHHFRVQPGYLEALIRKDLSLLTDLAPMFSAKSVFLFVEKTRVTFYNEIINKKLVGQP